MSFLVSIYCTSRYEIIITFFCTNLDEYLFDFRTKTSELPGLGTSTKIRGLSARLDELAHSESHSLIPRFRIPKRKKQEICTGQENIYYKYLLNGFQRY